MASGSSTYNPPDLNHIRQLTGSGSSLPGVKAYEARLLFSIADQDWMVSDGAEKSFFMQQWNDPVVGTKDLGVYAFAKLPARPGQYWKLRWKGRVDFIPRNAETGLSAEIGFRIINPTGGTEQTSLEMTEAGFFDFETVVSARTSLTADLDEHASWTLFTPFGIGSASGATSGFRLLWPNEIICELWNGSLPETNRSKNAGPTSSGYAVTPAAAF